ncbi:hypothetical protein PIB30_078868 [Stylosanthes scabra]|uniref:F-box domain-containing protein n=1 Tax=Stylosanthes scabra TaxID=79078 RepID=A0ABU6SRD4_9FABA|nr:hypothetical protein [Stylosanthes scabra]
MAGTGETTMSHLPEEILTNVFSAVSDTRTRNALSLVCRNFRCLERRTRTSLTLRGNARDLHLLPTCFRYVTDLDLSLISPWGHALFAASTSHQSDPQQLALELRNAFPRVTSLALYARSPVTLHLLLLIPWPNLRHVKLVRWHVRPPASQPGTDFADLFHRCRSLTSLDLSSFYHWPEDLPPVLAANPIISASMRRLNLLTTSFTEGFKSHEIQQITASCPNLEHLLLACTFDSRYLGYVGDETLTAVASNCPKLTLLHLGDTASLSNRRGDPNDSGFSDEDASISRATMVEFFSGLPLLEELVLDVCKNVRESCFGLEVLNSKCPKLRTLGLRQFHGICLAIGSQLDGVALCQGLHSLSVTNCGDLNDMGLIEIGRGCSRLVKFHVQGCKLITEKGLRTLTCLLRKTLVDVKISCCLNLETFAALRALEPIRDRIERLHVDCVWNGMKESDGLGQSLLNFDLNKLEDEQCVWEDFGSMDSEGTSQKKRQRCSYSPPPEEVEIDDSLMQSNGNGYWGSSWDKLKYLSLWIGVGDMLTPLPMAGLEDCPSLEEIKIRVEGDCRGKPKPSETEFGLSILACYPKLTKMQLDCGDTRGYALTAPSGQMDLSLWERDVQLREDYYPAPENDMSTEMRVGSCSRFEYALNRRRISD